MGDIVLDNPRKSVPICVHLRPISLGKTAVFDTMVWDILETGFLLAFQVCAVQFG
jgi:hypothetical protein